MGSFDEISYTVGNFKTPGESRVNNVVADAHISAMKIMEDEEEGTNINDDKNGVKHMLENVALD